MVITPVLSVCRIYVGRWGFVSPSQKREGVIMRLSKIEARRVFTRYGWQPINADAFAHSSGKPITTLESEDYRVQIYEGRTGIKIYARVTDRLHSERYHLSAYKNKLRYEKMKQELKLTTKL